jgi:predicted AAA+ superfamily ATPase
VLSLDNRAARDAASSDPEGFVAGLSRPVLLDEVQRAGPDLLLAIKGAVDADQTPGQFLLTGSANVLTNRKVQDALTVRLPCHSHVAGRDTCLAVKPSVCKHMRHA